MRFVFPTVLCISIFLFILPLYGISQNITGIWRGFFITESGEQYKYELQIDHSKKNGIMGVSYSYLDTRFYGKAELSGKFTRVPDAAHISETKTVEVKMAGGSVACIMKCFLNYSKSGKEEFLEGVYSSIYETSNPFFGVTRGANCGGGRVFLRKVTTSDFYLEPFLAKSQPKNTTTKKTTTPVTNKSTQNKKTTQNTVKKAPTPSKKEETVEKKRTVDVIETPTKDRVVMDNKIIDKKIATTPITTRNRKNELTRTIAINSEEIEIRLYDNGEIDDDTVSVYLNGKVILSNKRLSDKPITHKIKMEEHGEEFVLIMVAENMGRFPPNTSLLIVQDGDNRHQVSITSTELKNAMVRFRYQKK